MNKLYFGDNLDWLRGPEIADESVDLIYLDPPFNSHAHYNVLFHSPDADKASAQVEAFRDTWTWGNESEWAYTEIMKAGGETARLVDALRVALKESNMMAYLVMMAVRLRELHKKLKETGSLYLHCDPTASHYLKALLDGIFGVQNFTNELIWRRTTPKGLAFTRFASNHDTILFYRKSAKFKWEPQYLPYSPEYLERYNLTDEASGRKFQATSLLNPNANRPNLTYEFGGHTRVWRWTRERMAAAVAAGLIYFPPGGGVPREKRFLDEQEGVPVSSVWTDIPAINAVAQERIGYPTQKPLPLLQRIIGASTAVDDTVLDPFCGCGTTVDAAQGMGRQWIGIDVAIHAVKVIEARLGERYKGAAKYDLEGIPRDFASAVKLAERDKYQFQWWANYLFDPHALREQKKGADRGIDGEMFFPNGPGRPWGRMLTSVKGGEHVGPEAVRAFARVLERERAQLGLFICLYRPTREMAREATMVGYADVVHGDIPKLQIVAIEEFFNGRMPLLPPLEHLPSAAFANRRRPATPARRPDSQQIEMLFDFDGIKPPAGVVRHLNPRMVRGAA